MAIAHTKRLLDKILEYDILKIRMKNKIMSLLKNSRILVILWFSTLAVTALFSAIFWGPSFIQLPPVGTVVEQTNYAYPKQPSKLQADKIETLTKVNVPGWKQYHSSLGFSFQYPADLTVDQFVVGDPNTPGFHLNDPKQQSIFLFKQRADGSKDTIVHFMPAYDFVLAINDLRQKVIERDQNKLKDGSLDWVVVWKEQTSPNVYLREIERQSFNSLNTEVWIRTKNGVVITATDGSLLSLIASTIISD